MAIPVIIDTDIGFDVDDVWALAFALQCSEIDIKLITTCTGDTLYRAKVVAKLLRAAGREDIPIGVGIPLDANEKTHAAWVDDFDLASYGGEILRDGVGAICETAERCSEVVQLVCIGPLPNIAAALARDPNLTSNANFIGMHGSLRKGYLGADKPMREYNVKQHALACQRVFQASWTKTITPLDTCGTIVLEGERFVQVQASELGVTQAALENHVIWAEAVKHWPLLEHINLEKQSSILYDSVAVYLAFSQQGLVMEALPITVTDDGKTLIDEQGNLTHCATQWQDKDGFLDLLSERLRG